MFQNATTDNINVPCETLQQYGENIVCNHPELITQYQAMIIKTDQTTQDKPNKPIYQLEIQAIVGTQLTLSEITGISSNCKQNQ